MFVFGKFSVLCFLGTPVLRFAFLPYDRRLDFLQKLHLQESKILNLYTSKHSLHILSTLFIFSLTMFYYNKLCFFCMTCFVFSHVHVLYLLSLITIKASAHFLHLLLTNFHAKVFTGSILQY